MNIEKIQLTLSAVKMNNIFKIKERVKKMNYGKFHIKLLLDKQIFASSDAKFCRNTRNNGRYTQNFVHNMHNFSLDKVLSP